MDVSLSAISLSASSSDGNVNLGSGSPPITAVAVDHDKNSQQAVKWAVDHLLINTTTIILIHVRVQPNPLNNGFFMSETIPEQSREQMETEITKLFVPYRGFCARNGIHLKEVILEDFDVSQAIIDYITACNIQHIVIGASNRNAITRKFKNPDVATCLSKAAPEFCGVYVINKGKPVTIRPAKGPSPLNALLPRQTFSESPQKINLGQWEIDPVRNPLARGSLKSQNASLSSDEKLLYHQRSSSDGVLTTVKTAIDPNKSSIRVPRSKHESLTDRDFQGSMDFDSMDIGDFEMWPSSYEENSSGPGSPASGSQRDLEVEIRRLKLELKQTIEMHNAACREAALATRKARELHQWKLVKTLEVEELKKAEQVAFALVEQEQAKSRVAIEAAEEARRLAELEAKRRRSAEQKAILEEEEKRRAMEGMHSGELRYRKFTIDEISVATENFSEALKIGEGGYGPVYRASLDHTPVAIKILRPDAQQGRKQFQQEVEVLSMIRHPNMVLLLGACPENCCLVYEYMDYGSLEDRLRRRGNTPPIPWPVRFKIAAEIATVISFLHQTKPEPLVHRDLKPANILLDHNFVAKISDAGLARLIPTSVTGSITHCQMSSTAGTFFYIDPEYQQTGMLGVKSDIYSLGIILLQLVTARSPRGIAHHVDEAIKSGSFTDILDPSINDWPVNEALSFAKLALKCAELRRKDRPQLRTVILPELDRLRSFGQAYQNSGTLPVPSMPDNFINSQQATMSVHQLEQISNQDISTSWASSSIDDRGMSEC